MGECPIICPDCFLAGISQEIPLQDNECPECGGVLYDGEWHSAPQYPTLASCYTSWSELMGTKRVANVIRRWGKWVNIDVQRVC